MNWVNELDSGGGSWVMGSLRNLAFPLSSWISFLCSTSLPSLQQVFNSDSHWWIPVVKYWVSESPDVIVKWWTCCFFRVLTALAQLFLPSLIEQTFCFTLLKYTVYLKGIMLWVSNLEDTKTNLIFLKSWFPWFSIRKEDHCTDKHSTHTYRVLSHSL